MCDDFCLSIICDQGMFVLIVHEPFNFGLKMTFFKQEYLKSPHPPPRPYSSSIPVIKNNLKNTRTQIGNSLSTFSQNLSTSFVDILQTNKQIHRQRIMITKGLGFTINEHLIHSCSLSVKPSLKVIDGNNF